MVFHKVKRCPLFLCLKNEYAVRHFSEMRSVFLFLSKGWISYVCGQSKNLAASVCRAIKNGNCTVMSNYHLRSPNLSLKAFGLRSKVLSLPDDWDCSIAGLVSICREKETAVKSALDDRKQLHDN